MGEIVLNGEYFKGEGEDITLTLNDLTSVSGSIAKLMSRDRQLKEYYTMKLLLSSENWETRTFVFTNFVAICEVLVVDTKMKLKIKELVVPVSLFDCMEILMFLHTDAEVLTIQECEEYQFRSITFPRIYTDATVLNFNVHLSNLTVYTKNNMEKDLTRIDFTCIDYVSTENITHFTNCVFTSIYKASWDTLNALIKTGNKVERCSEYELTDSVHDITKEDYRNKLLLDIGKVVDCNEIRSIDTAFVVLEVMSEDEDRVGDELLEVSKLITNIFWAKVSQLECYTCSYGKVTGDVFTVHKNDKRKKCTIRLDKWC